MTGIEWAAALTALACVWLTVRNRISNWPWGIASVLFYAVVFWRTKLYANAGLQVLYFAPCCAYGWWVWARCGPTRDDDLAVGSLSRAARIVWLIVTAGLCVLIGLLMARYTDDPLPYADGSVTAMSISAQYLQAKKLLENWWLWIALDLVCVFYLFPMQKLWPSTALYAVFLVLAVIGAIEWRPLVGRAVTHA